MKEDVDYALVPAEVDNEQAWEIRILTGEFVETVIRYGNIEIDGKNEQLKFNFMIVHSADEDLTEQNVDLQHTAGDILRDLIENHIERGSVFMEDKKQK